MRSANCSLISYPMLPPTHQHHMWDAWDMAAEICLSQLPALVEDPDADFQPSPFFTEQLTAFEVWLDHGSEHKKPPEQLPIVLQCSAEMLVNMGIPWVILGHSKWRALLNESNEFVGDKVAYALSQGLKVIACIGETLEQRESGSTMDVVTAQTKAISVDWPSISSCC